MKRITHPAEVTINAITAWYLALRDRSVSLRFPARPSAATGSGEGCGAITKDEIPKDSNAA